MEERLIRDEKQSRQKCATIDYANVYHNKTRPESSERRITMFMLASLDRCKTP